MDPDEEEDKFDLIEKFIEIIKQEELHQHLLSFEGHHF